MNQTGTHDNASFSVLKHNGQHGDLLLVESEGPIFRYTEVYRAGDGSYLGRLSKELNPEDGKCRNVFEDSNNVFVGWFCDDYVCVRMADHADKIKVKAIDYLVEHSKPVSIDEQ